MSSDTNENSSLSYAIYDDPLYLSSSDQPISRLINHTFNGSNFLLWKRETYLALIAKNKEGFIDGSCKIPDKSDKKYHQWIRCDLLVRKWLLNSIDSSISDSLVYARSSKELWDEIIDRFGQTNSIEIYQLKKDLGSIVQENKPLVEYYSTLKQTWENIDSIDPVPTCTCKALDNCTCELLKRMLDRENTSKLIQFLMGLNSGFENVRTNILSMKPLPTLNKALVLLQKIERQKLISDVVDVLGEATAYAGTRPGDASSNDFRGLKVTSAPLDRSDKRCAYCHNIGHTRDECFKLRECSYCGRKGHKRDDCFQLKRQSNKPFRGRGSYRGGTTGYRRGANNVDTKSFDDTVITSTPLDDSVDTLTNPVSSSSRDSNLVDGIVTSLMEQVYKALSSERQQPSLSASNFAGPFQ